MKDRPQQFYSPRRHGPYYVRYKDGLETGFMRRCEAENLVSVFGGSVLRERPPYSPFTVIEKLPWFLVSFVLFMVTLGWLAS